MKLRVAALVIIAIVVVIVGASVLKSILNYPSEKTQRRFDVKVAFPSLHFNNPVGIYNAGDGTNRLFVVEQTGVIRVFENLENVTTANVFLDISDRVLSGGELGLLGLAFHPNFKENGCFYVDYTVDAPRRSVISRFSVSQKSSDQADANSEAILLQVEQPFPNHNGGQIAFGLDGYLYIALGDGGGAGDPLGNGQNRSTLLGSILRIDVNSASGGLNYSIPSDNPFVGNSEGYREEIYAYGLRNPWRFSFDFVTGWLWAADVGQNRIEEVDIIEKGKNYGWNIMEGSLCYSPPFGCNQTGLELPVWGYNHTLGYSVTGGFVYRGSTFSELVGAYIYGDYGSGRIWALQYNSTGIPVNTELVDTSLNIPSFGVDQKNELYICAFDGKIYKLQALNKTPP
jgi:glucose/arabinose dehydrogenase